MIGGNFTTFSNNRLKLTQFSYTPEVFTISFIAPELINLIGVQMRHHIDTCLQLTFWILQHHPIAPQALSAENVVKLQCFPNAQATINTLCGEDTEG